MYEEWVELSCPELLNGEPLYNLRIDEIQHHTIWGDHSVMSKPPISSSIWSAQVHCFLRVLNGLIVCQILEKITIIQAEIMAIGPESVP